LRVSNRIGIARSEDPEIVEQQLCAAMPTEKWTLTSDTLILHGRRICRPRPLCDTCVVRDDCDYYHNVILAMVRAGARKVRRTGTADGFGAENPKGLPRRSQNPQRRRKTTRGPRR
jgi:adenine-specific DNA glycosylase